MIYDLRFTIYAGSGIGAMPHGVGTLQAMGQSEKLIVRLCWRATLAQQPFLAAVVALQSVPF